MYYIIGDIHGEAYKLDGLIRIIFKELNPAEDILIFIGDYIDRGKYSFETLELLSSISKTVKCHFLNGNHELMLSAYLSGTLKYEYYKANGGDATIESYKKHFGSFFLPENHREILFSRKFFYVEDDFIAVHAGIPPEFDTPEECEADDLVWIREKFYLSKKRWNRTIIFGHTPTFYLKKGKDSVYIDDKRNIIGIDTGATYGGSLSCLRWPDKKIFQYNTV